MDLPRSGRLPVVFGESSLPLNRLSLELSGHRYGTGTSLLAGCVGEKVFSEGFSLSQSRVPSIDDCSFFDAEGVFHEGYSLGLIGGGVLRAVCTDRRTAARFSLPHTGSASGGYDTIPQASADHLRVERSDRTLSELLGGEPAVYIALASGGDFTPEGLLRHRCSSRCCTTEPGSWAGFPNSASHPICSGCSGMTGWGSPRTISRPSTIRPRW